MFEVNVNAFYKLSELCTGLGYSLPSLRMWIKQGNLKASKVGRDYIVSGTDLKDFLEMGSSAVEDRTRR
jgi:excisionase family DNA binding protein